MYNTPYNPGYKPLQVYLTNIGHCLIAANGSQRTFVIILKRYCRLAIKNVNNIFGQTSSLLYRGLSHSRVSVGGIGSYNSRYIANGKNIIVTINSINFVCLDAVTLSYTRYRHSFGYFALYTGGP